MPDPTSYRAHSKGSSKIVEDHIGTGVQGQELQLRSGC